MGKFNLTQIVIKNQKSVGTVVQRLIDDKIIREGDYSIGKRTRTRQGDPRHPKIEYGGNGNGRYRCYGNQKLILIHCGQDGCHPLFVVTGEGVNLETYVAKLSRYYS